MSNRAKYREQKLGRARAYIVHDPENPDECNIVYAATPAEAKHRSWIAFECGYTTARVRRAPQFDHLIDVRDPNDRDLLAAGWQLRCNNFCCERELYSEEGDPDQPPIVWRSDFAYCSERCAVGQCIKESSQAL